jgi:hypothetical protein
LAKLKKQLLGCGENKPSAEESDKVKVKLNTGFLSLMTGGYLGVLTAGGAEVTKYLASRGLGNIGKIKETIARMRGE